MSVCEVHLCIKWRQRPPYSKSWNPLSAKENGSTWLNVSFGAVVCASRRRRVLNTLSRSSQHHSHCSSCRLFTPCCGWVSDLPKSCPRHHIWTAVRRETSKSGWFVRCESKDRDSPFPRAIQSPILCSARNDTGLNGPPVSLAGPLIVKWICNSNFFQRMVLFFFLSILFTPLFCEVFSGMLTLVTVPGLCKTCQVHDEIFVLGLFF